MGASLMTLDSFHEIFHAETQEGNLSSFLPFYVGSQEFGKGVTNKKKRESI